MYRTDAANSAAAKPAPAAIGTEGYFKNPSGAIAGTSVDADWMNALQESLIAVLDDQSIAHSKSDHTKLLAAIRSLTLSEIAVANIGLPGYINGLTLAPNIGTHAIQIDAGRCRSSDNATTGILAVAVQKLPTVPWDLTTGGLASNNTWADPYFTRVWALHKANGNDINFGFDQDATATNLLSDASGDGFTTARQIGWGVRSGSTSWIPYSNAVNPDVFLSGTVKTPVNAVLIASTNAQARDLDIPEGTFHIGTHSCTIHNDVDNTTKHALLGYDGSPPAATANLMNFKYRAPVADFDVYSVFRRSVSNPGGSATLQGRIWNRFDFAPAAPGNTYSLTTEGFTWSRVSI